MNSPEALADLRDKPRPVLFENPEDDSESYRRPRENGVVIRQIGRYRYTVAITDKPTCSRDAHPVELYRAPSTDTDGHEFEGRCSCKGWFYHGSKHGEPCAHLWGLKLAAEHGTIEIEPLRDAIDSPGQCPTCGYVTTRGNR